MILYSINRRFSASVAYVSATVAVVVIAIVRALFVTELLPWLMFVPVVLACALLFGRRPAAWSLLLAAVLAAVSIRIPGEPYVLSPAQWGATFVFLLVGSVLILVGQQLRSAFSRAEGLTLDYEKALELAEERGDKLAEREAFLSGVLASSNDCIKVLDLDGRVRFMSEGGQRVMEVTDFGAIEGCPWESFWDGAGKDAVRDAVTSAKRGQAKSFTDQAPTMAGNMRWWDVAVTPIVGPSGKPERILSVSRDVTSTRTADEQVRLLNAELGHRLKNTLALVQAIVSQSLKPGDDILAARDALMDRLVALGHGAEILTANAWETADLERIARSVLEPHIGDGDRIEISGPRVRLSSRLGLSLSLALHELATNAAKYGALSNDVGKVTLIWEFVADPGPKGDLLRLRWEERGGPAVVEPTRRGFGSVLMGKALSANFKGISKTEYRPEGIVFALDAPVAALTELEQG